MPYLDNAATTYPKPPGVARAMSEAMEQGLGNAGRAGHSWALRADAIVQRCRSLLHRLLGGAGPERFVFTHNCTDSLNLALRGVLRPGDHVVTGNLEHNSLIRPLRLLGNEIEVKTTIVDCRGDGRYAVEDLIGAIRPDTRLVSICHSSNVLGTMQPIGEVGAACRGRGVLFLVDAAQTAGCLPIDLNDLQADLLAAPGHKALFGPTGTGILYVAPHVDFRPSRVGGSGGGETEGVSAVEAGTVNAVGIAGLAAGLEWILETGVESIAKRERVLGSRLDDWLDQSGLAVGPKIGGARLPLRCFRIPGLSPEVASTALDHAFDVGVRAGLHCAPGAHDWQGTAPDGCLRVSASALTSDSDLDALESACAELASSA